MKALDLTSPIQLNDGEYTFTEQRGALIRLRSSATGEYLVMHQAELSQRVVGMEPEQFAKVRLLDSVSEKQQERALTLAEHLREITTGEHPNTKKPRPQFDLATTTQEQRVQAKLAELEATPLRMVRSTLMSKLSAFKKGGEAALVDGRALTASRTADEDRELVYEALLEVIEEQRDQSTGTSERLIRLTRMKLVRQHGADAPAMPSDRTMYRLIETYGNGKHTTGSAKTRRSLGNRPDRPYGKSGQLLPGAEVQFDSTLFDVFVKVPGRDQMRPTLTIAMDVATRSVLGYSFRLVAAKSVDHVGLIAQTLTPLQNQPDRTKFRQMVQLQNPGCVLLSSDELTRLAQHRPFIYPRTLVIDNGKDFKANATLGAAESFHMNVVFSPPRTPTTKSIVERMFKSINTMFAQYLPGYTGRSVEFRGENVEKRTDLLDIYAVQELFHDWVINVWQNRPHDGLRDPLHPNVRFSPNQMAAAAASVLGTIDIPLGRTDYLNLLPSVTKTLQSTGLRHDNHFYDSPELHQFRGRLKRMTLHYDPYNPSAVWVKTPSGEFIECPTRDWDATIRPFFAAIQPDADRQPDLDPRMEVAYVGATLAGTALHQLPTAPPQPAILPTSFADDDDEVEALPEFNPEGN